MNTEHECGSAVLPGWDMSPACMSALLPYATMAFEHEFLDERVQHELQNFANELRARLQHEGLE